MYKIHLRRVLTFGFLGLVGAIIAIVASPKVYESQAGLILGSDLRQGVTQLSDDVMQILRLGLAQDPLSEAAVLRGKGLFLQAVRNVSERRNDPGLAEDAEDLFLMYDVQNERIVNVVSNVSIIVAKAHDAEVAADIANEITVLYNEFRRRSMNENVNQAITYLDRQVELTGAALNAVDSKIRQFRTENGVLNLEVAGAEVTKDDLTYRQQIENLMAEITAVKGNLAVDRAEYNRTPDLIDDQIVDIRDPVVQQYEAQMADLQREKALLLGRYLPDHPNVKQVSEALASVEAQLDTYKQSGEFRRNSSAQRPSPFKESLRTRIAQNQAALAGLERRLIVAYQAQASNNKLMGVIVAKEGDLLDLVREKDVLEANYRRFRSQMEDLSNRRDTAGRAAEVFFPAQPNPIPVAPDATKLVFISVIGGICLGVVYTFAIESMKLRVHTSGQLQELTGLPVVASQLALGRGQLRQKMRSLASGKADPNEAFRYLAVSMIAGERGRKRSVLFTSAGAGTGRATSAMSFAISSARMGVPTVIVDCDFGQRGVTRAFEMGDQPGVTDILQKGALPSAEEGAPGKATPHANLFVIPTGTAQNAALADFGPANVEAWLESLKEHYDLVVTIAPPCDEAADAAVLGGFVEDVFLVVSARNTPFRNIPLAAELLKRAGARSVSVVLSDASPGDEPFTARTASMS